MWRPTRCASTYVRRCQALLPQPPLATCSHPLHQCVHDDAGTCPDYASSPTPSYHRGKRWPARQRKGAKYRRASCRPYFRCKGPRSPRVCNLLGAKKEQGPNVKFVASVRGITCVCATTAWTPPSHETNTSLDRGPNTTEPPLVCSGLDVFRCQCFPLFLPPCSCVTPSLSYSLIKLLGHCVFASLRRTCSLWLRSDASV